MDSDASATLPPETLGTILSLPKNIAVREWRLSDTDFLASHANNKNVWLNLRNRMPHPYALSDATWFIKHCHDPTTYLPSGPWTAETSSQGPPLPTAFAITVNDEAVGSIALEPKDDVYFRVGELGYWLGEAHWGRGVMSAVVPAFLAWVWQTFGVLGRVEADTYAWNEGSMGVLRRAGFAVEGRREGRVWKEGRVGAEVMWGALRPGGGE